MDIRKVCVIGAGIMGSGSALTCARTGYTVSIEDIETGMLMRAFSRMSSVMKTLIEMTLLTEREANSSLERIEGTLSTTEAVKNADLIIEAVPEKIDLKKQVFKELDETCHPHTVFAFNTSTFLISEIAKSTKRPDKVIGTHWMNPPYLLPLVEVVRGAKTSDKTVNIV